MVRWSVEGEERLSDAATFHDFQDMHSRSQAAWGQIVAQGFGFAPTEINQKYERRFSEEEAKRWYKVRRILLLQDYGHAVLTGDREAIKDTKKAIVEYNKRMPSRLMKISAEDRRASLSTRRSNVRLSELGIAKAKRYRTLQRNTRKLFPITEADG